MAKDGPIPEATIAVIANPWQGPSNRTRIHGAVRARDSCLVINRGRATLIRLAISPAAYAVIVATHPASASSAVARLTANFTYGSSRNMSIGSVLCGSRVRAIVTSF